MSIRFKNFMTRIGKASEFKPLKNQLLTSLKESSENKYKNYPRLLELMNEYWPQYSEQSKISHLLKRFVGFVENYNMHLYQIKCHHYPEGSTDLLNRCKEMLI